MEAIDIRLRGLLGPEYPPFRSLERLSLKLLYENITAFIPVFFSCSTSFNELWSSAITNALYNQLPAEWILIFSLPISVV